MKMPAFSFEAQTQRGKDVYLHFTVSTILLHPFLPCGGVPFGDGFPAASQRRYFPPFHHNRHALYQSDMPHPAHIPLSAC